MYLKDFEFNGRLLSDFGCIPCYADSSNGSTISMDSSLSFEQVSNSQTFETYSLRPKYEENITRTFDIIKYSCGNGESEIFTITEADYIHNWLKQEKNKKFIPIYDKSDSDTIFYYGSFTQVEAIIPAGDIIGFKVTFTTNAPWGFVDDTLFNSETTAENLSFNFYNDSHKEGYLYPDSFEIECLSSGDFKLTNNIDKNNDVIIKSCLAGEKITIKCKEKIIESSIDHKALYNDFNYSYPRIVSDYDNEVNIFTTSIPCKITIKYSPIRKVGIFV